MLTLEIFKKEKCCVSFAVRCTIVYTLFYLDSMCLFGENAKFAMFICDVTAELMNIY